MPKSIVVDPRSLSFKLMIWMHANSLWGDRVYYGHKNPSWLYRKDRSPLWWWSQKALVWALFVPALIVYLGPGMILSVIADLKRWNWKVRRPIGWFFNASLWSIGLTLAEFELVVRSAPPLVLVITTFWLVNLAVALVSGSYLLWVWLRSTWELINSGVVVFADKTHAD